ncbi:phospholipase-like protein [Tanacetum coccineum]
MPTLPIQIYIRIVQQGVPRKVLHSMTHVQGYMVKKINAPILEAIFKKHGDIASDCVLKTASVRESILQVVCEVVKRIQTNDVATIVSDMEEIETQVLDAEATNMKVAWLRAHLEAIQKRIAAQKTSTSIVKMKANTTLVKRAAKMDLEERRIELLTAQERFDKAEKCVKVLDLVEMKLNDNFVESEAEKDLWPEQPLLQAD